MMATGSDDPAYIQAAESLLKMENHVIEVTHRSAKQEALRIPPRLIGIAAICNGDKILFEFLLRQDETIQEQYSYSPTLLPERQSDRERIANLIQERITALQTAAENQAKELAEEEAANEQRANERMERKRQAKSKQKKSNALREKAEFSATSDSEADSLSDHSSFAHPSHRTADKQQLARLSTSMATTMKEMTAAISIEDKTFSDSSWTIISKSSSRKPKLQALKTDTAGEVSKHNSSPILDAVSSRRDSAKVSETKIGTSPKNLTLSPQETQTDDRQEPVLVGTKSSDIGDLRQQVSKERQEITRLQALLVEKDAMLQNLQLRLYISDTRLRTYEEALRAHVGQVKSNLATEPSNDGNDLYPEDESKLLKKGVLR